MRGVIETILEHHQLFRRLSSMERSKLASFGDLRRCEAGTVLYRQGEPMNGFYLLVEGAVELSRTNRKGRNFALAGLHEGDAFGELELLDGGARQVTAQTTKRSQVVFFDAEGFSQLVAQRDRVACEMVMILGLHASHRLRELNRAIVEVLNEPTALGGRTIASRERPDRDFFHGLMAGLFTPIREEQP